MAEICGSALRRKKGATRKPRAICMQLLEQRVLLHHAGPLPELDDYAFQDADSVALNALANATAASTKLPLSSLPSLSSDPGAPVTMYLDFVGAPAMTWLSYNVPATPAFDQDNDPTTFNSAELTAINDIWRDVADEYSPFNINVTTVNPGTLVHGKSLELIIGGNDGWLGASAGGVSYIGAFTDTSLPNISFVFTDQLGKGVPKYTAMATAHEAGHQFGLYHQANWSGGTLLQDYSDNGGSTATAPIMGDSYGAARGLWWNGTSDISSTTIQDDMAVISGANNGFGYRPDDYPGNITAPATLTGTSFSTSGIIGSTSDVDYFQFTTGAGSVNISVGGLSISDAFGALHGMLDPKLSLYTSSDQLLATSDTGLSETISTTLLAGTYIIAVGSHGSYGDVGEYTLNGTAAALPPTTPTSLTASVAGTSEIDLNWSDTAGDQIGFQVQRSIDNQTWSLIASTTATSYSDSNLNDGTTFYYRIRAYSGSGSSAYTSAVSATTLLSPPAAPDNLSVTATQDHEIDLSWTDHSNNESGFYIERSLDGTIWSQIDSVAANMTSYSDTGLTGGKTYFYRVRAYNAGGTSAYTDVASIAALPAVVPASAASDLVASSMVPGTVNLNWTGNAGDDGFLVQRSTDRLNWTTVADVGSATSYTDQSVNANSQYTYRILAYNPAGDAPPSHLLSLMTPGYSVLLDNDDPAVTTQGVWYQATNARGYYGDDFFQDGDIDKGQSSVTFAPNLAVGGAYQVLMRWTSSPNRADNVPVQINDDGGKTNVLVNEKSGGGQWVLLGAFNFTAGSAGSVVVSNSNTRGFVAVDAVEFVKISDSMQQNARVASNANVSLAAPLFSMTAISANPNDSNILG